MQTERLKIMNTYKSALEYAKMCCDTIMRKFHAKELPPKGRFHYHAGVFLSGMERCFLLNGMEKYNEYIKAFIDEFVDNNGKLNNANLEKLDDMQPCNLMFRYCNRDDRYNKVLDSVVPRLLTWKTNKYGGFWHMGDTPDQMWLDSLYMGGPLAVRYGLSRGKREYIELIHKQMELMFKNMRNKKTGLLYHAWDCSKKELWANHENGCSGFFWGRAIGWVIVATADIAEYLGDDVLARSFMDRAVELTMAVLKYQDPKSNLWFQVVDKGDDPDNWTETSCSCLFLYGLCKLIRMGAIDNKYIERAEKAFHGIIKEKTYEENGNFIVKDICIGTGVGDYKHYIERPTVENDLHGTGAFTLMCTEYEKMQRKWKK